MNGKWSEKMGYGRPAVVPHAKIKDYWQFRRFIKGYVGEGAWLCGIFRVGRGLKGRLAAFDDVNQI